MNVQASLARVLEQLDDDSLTQQRAGLELVSRLGAEDRRQVVPLLLNIDTKVSLGLSEREVREALVSTGDAGFPVLIERVTCNTAERQLLFVLGVLEQMFRRRESWERELPAVSGSIVLQEHVDQVTATLRHPSCGQVRQQSCKLLGTQAFAALAVSAAPTLVQWFTDDTHGEQWFNSARTTLNAIGAGALQALQLALDDPRRVLEDAQWNDLSDARQHIVWDRAARVLCDMGKIAAPLAEALINALPYQPGRGGQDNICRAIAALGGSAPSLADRVNELIPMVEPSAQGYLYQYMGSLGRNGVVRLTELLGTDQSIYALKQLLKIGLADREAVVEAIPKLLVVITDREARYELRTKAIWVVACLGELAKKNNAVLPALAAFRDELTSEEHALSRALVLLAIDAIERNERASIAGIVSKIQWTRAA